ncbi:helix-turn-helix transcriptional regulator [Streptococcus gallolyticus subsp. gallolyticus]|uniref:helix-turn-helix domain-containing protein n=1 Tax=Streptococcus gallolyticus TaxID=315405 RepID=UPI002284BCDB|nr:helix-turn-helix transcriptional regulator [Streptococcus gallolyticus]MCY7171749.1 helix-turn-helix transcriptional regulator [Streptococcus gallolyticus subsp. gallolyticus]
MWKKLNHILIEKGLTKKELAEKAGISQNTIQNIRNSKISFRNMVKIADVLDVSLDEFRKDNT